MISIIPPRDDLPPITLSVDDSMLPVDVRWLSLEPFDPRWLTLEHNPSPARQVDDARPAPIDITRGYDPHELLLKPFDPSWLDLGTGQRSL